MKLAAVILSVLFTQIAQAEVFVCIRSEPYFKEVINSEDGTLYIFDSKDKPTRNEQGVRLIQKGANILEFVATNGSVLRTIQTDIEGDDGSGEIIYPMSGGPSVGCFTKARPRTCPAFPGGECPQDLQ